MLLFVSLPELVGGKAVQTDDRDTVACGIVFRSVGYRGVPLAGVTFDEQTGTIPNEGGRVEPGVYAAGDTRAQLAKQITTAVGDATTAVLHAERYIEELKDLERAFPSEPKDVVAQTASKAELLTFAPGDLVLKEGDPADRFYMVIKGEAEATRRGPDGSQEVINRFGPGDYFGEIGLLNDAPRKATVRAKTSLEVMALDRETFATLIKSSRATEDAVRRVAAERTRATSSRGTACSA